MSNVLDFQVNGAFASTVGGTGTAVKYFPRPLPGYAGAAGAGPGGSLPATPSSTSAVGALFIPAANVYNGQQIDVLASGTFGSDSGDPSGTVTVEIKAVTGSLTNPTYTSLATTGAITPSLAIEPWALQVTLMGASKAGANGVLVGAYQAFVRANRTSPTTLTNVVTALDFGAGNPALQQGAVFGLVVGVTFGTSDASNTANLYQFSIES